ncbi:MAG: helix-turn-helix transcriptional regulator, partial [Bacteroidaceae bacterium]|nr:helix-turn-helix transcriptional regulator [Bacteroidaceae bacterium]
MKTIVGKKIHDRRIALGISALELAKRVGVSRGFIYLLEQGGSGISPERLCDFARALGIAVTELDPDAKQIENTAPEWLDYLRNEYGLGTEDCRELLK